MGPHQVESGFYLTNQPHICTQAHLWNNLKPLDTHTGLSFIVAD